MVYHVSKDGSLIESIEGYVVSMEDAPSVYDILRNIENDSNASSLT